MKFELYGKAGTQKLPDIKRNPKIYDPKLYKPSEGLINAVNVSLALGQPLLLTGEPGTGKTQLAYHLAYYFELGDPIVFNAQTTSTAKDLFYHYDALGHFQYAQTNKERLSQEEVEKLFVVYQGLGKAIKSNRKFIVLIDEIDKAPRDLPNDVLAALEELKFRAPEINRTYSASPENRPIIVMTSNSEKNLPDAFLRRVVYYHIPFPDEHTLLEILQLKVDGFSIEQLKFILRHFNLIRKGRKVKLKKNPATAELIFWTSLLQRLEFDPQKLADLLSLNPEEKIKLETSYTVLAKNKDDLALLRSLIGKK